MINGQLDLFRGLAQDTVDEALALGSRITVPSGEMLFGLGDPAENLYVVERGLLRLTLPMQIRGKEEDVLVEERSPGQTVGWSALVPPYRFTMKASAPVETGVIALSRDALRGFFALNPSVGYVVTLNLAAVIGQRLQLFQAMWLREMQHVVQLRCA